MRAFAPALRLAANALPGGSFLDVGCGIGTKLLLAQRLGLRATGIEIDPRQAARAQRIAPGAEIICADVRRWSGFGRFDIVYCYSPLDEPDESELEARIAGELGPDAVFLLAYRDAPSPWRRAAPHVWVRE